MAPGVDWLVELGQCQQGIVDLDSASATSAWRQWSDILVGEGPQMEGLSGLV